MRGRCSEGRQALPATQVDPGLGRGRGLREPENPPASFREDPAQTQDGAVLELNVQPLTVRITGIPARDHRSIHDAFDSQTPASNPDSDRMLLRCGLAPGLDPGDQRDRL